MRAEKHYTTNRKGAARNGQLPPANRSIRMTVHVCETVGRSFLIVMDLLEDCPCNLKRCENCSAEKREQQYDLFKRHRASPPFRICVREEQTIRLSHPPGSLPEGARPPLCRQHLSAAFSGTLSLTYFSAANKPRSCSPQGRGFAVEKSDVTFGGSGPGVSPKTVR